MLSLTSIVIVIPGIARHLRTRISLNTTPSLPIGFYAASTAAKSNLISFCVPQPWGVLALQRHYRTRENDACPDGGEPLLKRVVARAGDVVSESADGIAVNGKLLPMSKPLPLDSGKRPLQPYMIGRTGHVANYVLQDGEVWVMGENPKSFDSRYYGPIPTKLILTYWEPKATWK